MNRIYYYLVLVVAFFGSMGVNSNVVFCYEGEWL